MALTASTDRVDETGKELLSYGTPDFPVAFFDDDLTKIRVPWHWHEEMEIVVLLSGTVTVRIANHVFTLQGGEGYFANSGVLHAADLLSDTGHQHCLIFSPALVSPARDLIFNTYVKPIWKNPALPCIHLKPDIPWQKDILAAGEQAFEAGAWEQTDFPMIVRDQVTRIFSVLVKNQESLSQGLSFTDRDRENELRIKKTLTFIETHYAEKITIEDIAGSADISVSTCLRLCRQVLGTTPVSYLASYRLQQAESLLKTSEASVGTIAEACGFPDAGYFIKCFRRAYGTTPARYRDQKESK